MDACGEIWGCQTAPDYQVQEKVREGADATAFKIYGKRADLVRFDMERGHRICETAVMSRLKAEEGLRKWTPQCGMV